MTAKPFPNEIGQRVFDQVSQPAWQEWLVHSRSLINEYRLNLATPEGRKLLMEACERFFFGGEDTLPPEYTPPPTGTEPGSRGT
jgi:Fe-S cluster biosynthesis and repair protein YggX